MVLSILKIIIDLRLRINNLEINHIFDLFIKNNIFNYFIIILNQINLLKILDFIVVY
jgi:hypothetical protein